MNSLGLQQRNSKEYYFKSKTKLCIEYVANILFIQQYFALSVNSEGNQNGSISNWWK